MPHAQCMNTTVICIGRNVGDQPMADMRWDEFKSDTLMLVIDYGAEVYNFASGTGFWQDQEEDTYIVSFGLDDTSAIEQGLSALARAYDQEAISLIVGESVVVSK